jgi:hypothetical protein
MLGTAVRPGFFLVERDRADGSFDGFVVAFNAAIVDDARQAPSQPDKV